MGALKINVSDTSGQSWPLVLHQTLNQSSTGWGPGIKFLNASDSSSKWAGIGGMTSSEYANNNDLVFYTSAEARFRMNNNTFYPIGDAVYNLGGPTVRWANVYGVNFHGKADTVNTVEISCINDFNNFLDLCQSKSHIAILYGNKNLTEISNAGVNVSGWMTGIAWYQSDAAFGAFYHSHQFDKLYFASNSNGTNFTRHHQIAYLDQVLPLSGGTMTGAITMNTGTGIQMKYESGKDTCWIYPNGADTYGIRYYTGSPDRMAISASGNNNTTAGADLCINGNGEGTVTIRGNTILHAGNYTSYTVTKTGTGASGTWGISITGNATTASSASWASGASYTERVAGYYTGNGGAQGPSYIGRGNVKFNMMNQFPNAGTTNYMDCILMNTYGGDDVPRATAFGIERYSGRAWIAEGSDTSSTWEHVYEVISTRNIASQSVNYATTAGQASTANRLTSTTAMWGEPGTHDGKWVKICQETLGGWRNARLVLAISSRYQGTGIFSLTLDVNSAGLAPISGSLNYNGSCPYGISFKAYYNESTGNFTMWMLYNNYSQANITVLESYQWYSSIQYYGVWDTIPSDVGYEIGIKVNAGDTCHNFGANQPSGSAQVGALYYQTIG